MAEEAAATGPGVLSLDPALLVRMLRMMQIIRCFEDRVFDLFAKGMISGSTHLCQGQEAVAVGACFALRADDLMVCTYRGHGACLAKGMGLRAALAEILGRSTGCCGGKGGSMHLADVSVGAMGSFAIVGAGIPVAAGLAWASRQRGADQVTLAFFGDGATNIGAFHEGLNLASIWRLPVVFVCENNLYGEYSPLAATTPVRDLAVRARSYAMPAAIVDGNDVEEVHRAVGEAVERARRGQGPTLVECKTYRHKGHSRSDPARYRPAGELERWLARDPILVLGRRLLGAGVLGQGDLDRIEAEARAEVAEAERQALADPLPEAARLVADVTVG